MTSDVNLTSIFITNTLSLVLLLVTVVGCRWRLTRRDTGAICLNVIAICIVISCLVDPFVFFSDGKSGFAHYLIIYLGNSWLFIANVLIGPCWLMFIAAHLHQRVSKPLKVTAIILNAVCLIMVIVNPLRPVLFNVTLDNVYERGPGFVISALVGLFFVASILWLYVKARRKAGVLVVFPLWALVIPIVVGILLQAVFYGISVVWPCVCISFAGVMLCLQTDILRHDSLTGLCNSTAFWRYAKRMIEAAPKASYVVVASDIENFKGINERYGTEKGDELLKYVGQALSAFNSKDALFARYSNDRFVGMLRMPRGEYSPDAGDAMMLAGMQTMYENAPIEEFSVKFGIYDDVDKSLSVATMCDRAFIACNSIKRTYGVPVAHYTDDLGDGLAKRRQLIDDMEGALNEGQFCVYYQPKHDAQTGKVAGAEALVRWNHPHYGFMTPGEFLSVFESTGFVSKLDYYVWMRVVEDLNNWVAAGHRAVPVSVNTSRKDYFYNDYLEYVQRAFSKAKVDPELLHIEVTESAYVDRADDLIERVEAVRALGVKVELDDFGSGYSSLGSLALLPIDVVKLDMSFMRDFEQKKTVIESAVALCHSLGFTVVAEGVETPEQLEQLKRIGCDIIQGYCYSKPLSREDFEAYLEEHGC